MFFFRVLSDNMIQFKSKNFMFKKTVNRMLHARYVPKIWDTVSILDEKDNLISYHSSYSEDFEKAVLDNGVFLVLACMEYCDFHHAKSIEFGEKYPGEYLWEFIVASRNHRNIFLIPESQCPPYESPEFFGIKIKKIDDEFEITYGLTFRESYDICFDRGYEDIEIVYADELKIAEEYDRKPVRFIPFNDNDDELDKFSVNNLINQTLIRFMYDGLSFKTNL